MSTGTRTKVAGAILADLRVQDPHDAIYLDLHGAISAWFTEHHFVEDGYLPPWIPVASAMAAHPACLSFVRRVCVALSASTRIASSSTGAQRGIILVASLQGSQS